MNLLLWAGNWLLPLGYLALAIDYGATFILRTRTHARNPAIAVVALAHLALLLLLGLHFGPRALTTVPELLSVVALSCTVVYGVVELLCRDRRAGVFVFLLVFLIQYSSAVALSAVLANPSAAPAGQTGWGQLHFVLACLAYTAMAMAAVYAVLYLAGRRGLKEHRFGLLFDRLPPLELLGRMSWYALVVGLVFISVTVVTGVVMSALAPAGATLSAKIVVKIVTGLAAWAACALAVVGKAWRRWSAWTVSWIAVAGFLVVVVLLVASVLLS